MNTGKILIVDDNPNVCSALELLLQEEFSTVEITASPEGVPERLVETPFDVVLLDMNFTSSQQSGTEGMFWLDRILEAIPTISVIMLTAYGDVELAVRALKRGAVDFVLKPWENEKLLATVHTAVRLSQTRQEVKDLRATERLLRNELRNEPCLVVGESPAFRDVLDTVRKVAGTDANVLITGENGTGKEVIAREIHRLSPRRNQLMVTVDMGAVSETLFESELFGHVRGAYTDARNDRTGKFELASKGTLFLDEIGNLPLALQAKLLAVIQNRAVSRLGSNKSVAVDIRLITATNQNLVRMVQEGRFREDLYFRINTIHIEVPPLRNRKEDIPALAHFFLRKFASRYGKGEVDINAEAIEKLKSYSWPGNIRELQHTIEKAVILTDREVLTPNDFILKPVMNETGYILPETLEQMERIMIMRAIERNCGNITAAAAQLGVARQTFYNKMRRYNIGQP